MPKYLLHATYTVEGIRGLIKDTASGRRATQPDSHRRRRRAAGRYWCPRAAPDAIAEC